MESAKKDRYSPRLRSPPSRSWNHDPSPREPSQRIDESAITSTRRTSGRTPLTSSRARRSARSASLVQQIHFSPEPSSPHLTAALRGGGGASRPTSNGSTARGRRQATGGLRQTVLGWVARATGNRPVVNGEQNTIQATRPRSAEAPRIQTSAATTDGQAVVPRENDSHVLGGEDNAQEEDIWEDANSEHAEPMNTDRPDAAPGIICLIDDPTPDVVPRQPRQQDCEHQGMGERVAHSSDDERVECQICLSPFVPGQHVQPLLCIPNINIWRRRAGTRHAPLSHCLHRAMVPSTGRTPSIAGGSKKNKWCTSGTAHRVLGLP